MPTPPAPSLSRPRRESWAGILAILAVVVCLVPACAPKTSRPTIDSSLTAQEAAKQREMAARDFLEKKRRMRDVSTILLMENAELCGSDVIPMFGFTITTSGIDEEDKEWGPVWDKVYNAGDRVLVVSVDKGAPADLAGMQEGDLLTTVNGVTLGRGKEGFEQALEEIVKAHNATTPATFGLLRQGQPVDIQMSSRLGCNYPVQLALDSEVNAFATGKGIVVNTGMMDFVHSDDELGMIIGHELAHNTMGHIKAKQGNALLAGVFGAVLSGLTGVNMTNLFMQAGGGAFSQEFEHEADYVGLYYTARAGFNIEHEPDLWRRMAIQHPAAINRGSTHPPTAERFVALEADVKEIMDKQAAGQPLEPNMKK